MQNTNSAELQSLHQPYIINIDIKYVCRIYLLTTQCFLLVAFIRLELNKINVPNCEKKHFKIYNLYRISIRGSLSSTYHFYHWVNSITSAPIIFQKFYHNGILYKSNLSLGFLVLDDFLIPNGTTDP